MDRFDSARIVLLDQRQCLYVHPQLITAAAQHLAHRHSFITLQSNPDDTIVGPTGVTLHRVVPAWIHSSQDSYHTPLNHANPSDTPLQVIWSDCFRVTAAVAGSNADVPTSLNRSPRRERILLKGQVLEPREEDFNDVGRNMAQRMACTLIDEHHMILETVEQALENTRNDIKSKKMENVSQERSLFDEIKGFGADELKSTVTIVRSGCIDGRSKTEEHKMENNMQIMRLWKLYGKCYLTAPDQFAKFCKQLGINQYYEPTLGEGIVTIPALLSQQWARFVECSYNPNFHFAGVCLIDDDNRVYVTLENWAVEDPEGINDLWGFQVYSYEPESGKTYHDVLTKTGGYGNIALTFGVQMHCLE